MQMSNRPPQSSHSSRVRHSIFTNWVLINSEKLDSTGFEKNNPICLLSKKISGIVSICSKHIRSVFVYEIVEDLNFFRD